MSSTYEIIFTANYKNTDQTREYTISEVDSLSADVETVRTKAVNINDSLTSGQASIVSSLFVSPDYDPSENIGELKSISDVKIKTITRTEIPKPLSRMIEMQTDESEEYEHDDDNFIGNNDDQR